MDVETLIKDAGGVGKLAAKLGVSHTSVCDWKRVGFIPSARIVQISAATAIPVEALSKLIRPVASGSEAA